MRNFRLLVGIILTYGIAPVFAVEGTKEIAGQENPEVVKLLEKGHLEKTYFESLPNEIRFALLQNYYSSGATLQDAIWNDKLDVVKDILSKGLNEPNTILPEKTYLKKVVVKGIPSTRIEDIGYKSLKQTPLMFAIILQRDAIIKYLLNAFTNITDFQNPEGKTALMYAVENYYNLEEPQREVVLDLLLQNGAKRSINAKDKKGNTVLHYAVKHTEYTPLIKKLFDSGADPNIINEDGKTMLDLAAKYLEFYPHTRAVLISRGAKTAAQLAGKKH